MSWNVQLLGLHHGMIWNSFWLLRSFVFFCAFWIFCDLVHEFKPVRWSKLCKQQDATSLCFEVKGCHRNKLRLEQLDMLHQRCWQEQQPDLREMMPGWDGRCESLEAPGNLEIDKARLKMFESCCVVSENLSRWTAAKPRSLGLELCCTSCSRSQLLSWLQRRKRPLRKQWRGRLLMAFVVCGMSLERTASHLSRSLYRWGDTWIHHDHFEHYSIWVGLRRWTWATDALITSVRTAEWWSTASFARQTGHGWGPDTSKLHLPWSPTQ